MVNFAPVSRTHSPQALPMRTLLITMVFAFALTACGYRTPLALPKPALKPPATAPEPASTTNETK